MDRTTDNVVFVDFISRRREESFIERLDSRTARIKASLQRILDLMEELKHGASKAI